MQLVLVVIGLCISGIHSLYMEKDEVIHHVEPVINFQMTGINEGPVTIEHGHRQDHADEIEVSFSAFNKKWFLDMYIDHNMFSPTSAFHYFDADGIKTTRLPHHSLYKTKPGLVPQATLNIHDDGLVHAMISTEDDHYVIDPMYNFQKKYHIDSEMGMYRLDDVEGLKLNIPRPSNSSQSRRLAQNGVPINIKDINSPGYTTTAESTDTGEPTKWTNCYPNQQIERNFAIGFSVTSEYYLIKGGGNAAGIEAELKNLLADSNSIYVPQMGVHLYIEQTDIQTSPPNPAGNAAANPPWNRAQANPARPTNTGCGETASDTLGKYRLWRQNLHPTDAGLWHLMTTCFPPSGTVGVAYLNAMCSPRVGSGLSSSGTARTWTIVAHELGHNFGGEHSFEEGQGRTGGIMDYGNNQKINGVWQFNTKYRKVEVCAQIARSQANPGVGRTGTCWSNFVATGQPTYAWVQSTEAAACSLTCIPKGSGLKGTQTPKAVCEQTTVAGVKSIVANANCATLPPPELQSTDCDPTPPECEVTCGDGIVSPGETCDSGATPDVCCINCQLKTDDPNCIRTVDACFNSIKNERKFCFRGDEYNRYTITSATQQNPDPGYPKKIAGNFQNLPAGFTSDFDAIIQRNEGRVYFIKGLQYVTYELGFGASTAPPASAATLLGLPPTWTKLDAAISTFSGQGGAYLWSGDNYCRFQFRGAAGDACSDSIRPITDFNAGDAFPFPNIEAAARYWPDVGIRVPALDASIDLIYQGKFIRYKFGVGLTQTIPSAIAPFGTAAAVTPGTPGTPGTPDTGTTSDLNLCDSTGCVVCLVKTQCTKCDPDLYDLVQGACYPKEYIAEMLFDKYDLDSFWVKSTNVPSGKWTGAQGNTGTAASLDANSFINLDVSKLPRNLEDFEFHFWVKLDPTTPVATPINMVACSASHDDAEVELAFWLDPCRGQTTSGCDEGGFRPTLTIQVTQSIDNVQSGVVQADFVVKINKYVHLIASIDRGMIRITSDGAVMATPYGGDLTEQTDILKRAWIFQSFIIGKAPTIGIVTNHNSITGVMDQFHIDKLRLVDGIEMSDAKRLDSHVTVLISLFAFLFISSFK